VERTIAINSEEQYQEFLRGLPKYRGLLGYFTTYTIRGTVHTKELHDFERALNLKNRRKRITYLYDRVCDIIDQYNAEQGITCHYSAEGICEDPKHQTRKNGCCCHCYLQRPDGCPTRNLSCKFYFCDHLAKKYHALTMEDIDLLKLFTWSEREIIKNNVFVTRKTYINLLCLGSYLLFCIYSVVKFYRIKNVF
jgi:hypothetical protein